MVVVEGGKEPFFALNTAHDRPIKWVITKVVKHSVVLTASLGLIRGQEQGVTIECSQKLPIPRYAKLNHWRLDLPDLPLWLRPAKNRS
jgi:hypothetical protein